MLQSAYWRDISRTTRAFLEPWPAWRMVVSIALVVGLVGEHLRGQQLVDSQPNLQALVAKADFVIRGRVLFGVARWDARRVMIFTDYTIGVIDVLMGSSGSSVVMSFAGGTVGDQTIAVTDVPTLRVGEELIVFGYENARLYPTPVVHGRSGLFRVIVDDSAQAERIVDFDWYQIEKLDNGQLVRGPLTNKGADGAVTLVQEAERQLTSPSDARIDRDASGKILSRPDPAPAAASGVTPRGIAITSQEFLQRIIAVVAKK